MTDLEPPLSKLLRVELCLAGWASAPSDLELAVAKPSDCAVASDWGWDIWPDSAASMESRRLCVTGKEVGKETLPCSASTIGDI